MSRDDVVDFCKNLFKLNCSDDVEYVDIGESEFLSVCGMDSFAFVMVYSEISAKFGITNKMFDTSLPKTDITLKQLVDFIMTNKVLN